MFEIKKRKGGFNTMSVEERRKIASKGGRSAHAKGSARKWTPKQAAEAGRKGAFEAHARGTAHQWSTSTEASRAGLKGGKARAKLSKKRLRKIALKGVSTRRSRANLASASLIIV